MRNEGEAEIYGNPILADKVLNKRFKWDSTARRCLRR